MATFHKIVLAIASSWNHGTSSPAPQGGNRALSNQTNALASAFAERQAQPSAKTPPNPNRIGKGIGKFWIPILLATTLMTIPIEQAEAQRTGMRLVPDARITINSDGTRVTNRINPRTLQAIPNTQPSAVLNPVVVNPVTGAALRKGAIKGGKWLIAVLAEYGVHSAIDRVLANNRDQKATTTVHGSRWLSHEYSYNITSPTNSIYPYGGNWTTTANMGDRNILTSAYGWWGNLNRTMTQDEAIDVLEHRMSKSSIVRLVMSYWDPTHRVRGRSGRLYPVIVVGHNIQAREGEITMQKAIELNRIRQSTGNRNIVWFREEQRQKFKRNIGSFGMFSDFVDPKPILKALGTENAIDSEANYYEATATWRYRNLKLNGTWGEWEDDEKTFSQDTGDGIKSWTDHHFSHDFCKNNQEITEPAIYEGIERFVSTRDVFKKFFKIKEDFVWIGFVRYRRTFYTYEWRPVDEEPVVVQQYQDLTGN